MTVDEAQRRLCSAGLGVERFIGPTGINLQVCGDEGEPSLPIRAQGVVKVWWFGVLMLELDGAWAVRRNAQTERFGNLENAVAHVLMLHSAHVTPTNK